MEYQKPIWNKRQLKRLISTAAILVVAVFGIFVGGGESITPPLESSDLSASDPTLSESILATRVIDGDTIEIAGGEKVRYIGIDTPEIVDPRSPVECFGKEATAENKKLVEGKMVRLEKDISERDKYGRLLRYVWVGDTLVNLELVRNGFAHASSYPPDIARQDELIAAEKTARESELGLWRECQRTESGE